MPFKLHGVNHIGIPVRSLDETLGWYREMFDLEPMFCLRDNDDPAFSEATEVPNAKFHVAFMRLGNTFLEFLEYERPRGAPFELRNCDIGALHICLEVDDIHAVYNDLRAKGVPFSSEPMCLDLPGLELDGVWSCFFRDPHGIQFEVYQVPLGGPAQAVNV